MIRNRVVAPTTGQNHILLNGSKTIDTSNALWGRRKNVSSLAGFLSMGAVIASPLFALFLYICLENFDGAMWKPTLELFSSPIDFFLRYLPGPTSQATILYASWVAMQAALYSVLPGRIVYGPPTPAGHTHPYRMNGRASWFATIGTLAIVAVVQGIDAVASVAQNWGGILVAANIYGIAFSVISWLKGHLQPSFEKDRRFSGSVYHDFLSGVELNPRIGGTWDFKLFQIGRLGMNSWVVIDLCFMAGQYNRFGAVSNSMVAVTLLHALYTVDFFVNEAWYLATIDIAHDHFGFYLCWGSAVWLPMVYTTQAQYLSTHPVQLSPTIFYSILGVGLLSYILFRLSNNQKDSLRKTRGDCKIFGKKPEVIRAKYTTGAGAVHDSLLLCSGCWGVVRHPNYVGDIIFSFCVCACCEWTHLLPYTYLIWMTGLLVHRCYRDEKRCSIKYGKYWEQYQRTVRWRMIPGVF
ncbi:ergosterol biosynthesis ERG4/ERG24 [Aspergillus sergii]|uniref:7-dehydrocholesterol reductase n=1 Tax=Aspergillus sergii TaxID=1034303 RepID=A0A5N6XH12_9EURO|nr:ergosterol biosynthesis ERG4/ERG24 [Aspergillus sergii]